MPYMEEDMAQALLPYGFMSVHDMHPKILDNLAKNIAFEVKNKITRSTTFFGYNETQLEQLEYRISDIAQAVAQYEDMNQIRNANVEDDGDNYYLLTDENDDANIPLKPYMPSMHL